MKEECLVKLSNWVGPICAISKIPIDDLPTYKAWPAEQESIQLTPPEVESIKEAVEKAKTIAGIELKGVEGKQLIADLDGILEDGEKTKWVLRGERSATRVDETIHDVQMSVIQNAGEFVAHCECGK